MFIYNIQNIIIIIDSSYDTITLEIQMKVCYYEKEFCLSCVMTSGRSEQSGYFGIGREFTERSKCKSQTLHPNETAYLPPDGQEPLPHHPSRSTSISAGNEHD